MTKEITTTGNPFLDLVEKMAKRRKKSVEEFAERFRFTPKGLDFLKDCYWFYPSEALIDILREEVELTDAEELKLEKILFKSQDLEPAEIVFEIIQIIEWMINAGNYQGMMEAARREIEKAYCFDQPNWYREREEWE